MTTNKKGRSHVPIVSASKIVHRILSILLESGLTYREIAKRSGSLGQNAPGRWRKGMGTPSVYTMECLAETLGYSLEILTLEEKAYLEAFRRGETKRQIEQLEKEVQLWKDNESPLRYPDRTGS